MHWSFSCPSPFINLIELHALIVAVSVLLVSVLPMSLIVEGFQVVLVRLSCAGLGLLCISPDGVRSLEAVRVVLLPCPDVILIDDVMHRAAVPAFLEHRPINLITGAYPGSPHPRVPLRPRAGVFLQFPI